MPIQHVGLGSVFNLVGVSVEMEDFNSSREYVVLDAVGLRVLCSYELTAMGKFALLRYLSEFRLRVSSF